MHNLVLLLLENIWEKVLMYKCTLNKVCTSIYCTPIITSIRRVLQKAMHVTLHESLCTGIVNDLVYNIYIPYDYVWFCTITTFSTFTCTSNNNGTVVTNSEYRYINLLLSRPSMFCVYMRSNIPLSCKCRTK